MLTATTGAALPLTLSTLLVAGCAGTATQVEGDRDPSGRFDELCSFVPRDSESVLLVDGSSEIGARLFDGIGSKAPDLCIAGGGFGAKPTEFQGVMVWRFPRGRVPADWQIARIEGDVSPVRMGPCLVLHWTNGDGLPRWRAVVDDRFLVEATSASLLSTSMRRDGVRARALAQRHGFGGRVEWERPMILWRNIDSANHDALWLPKGPGGGAAYISAVLAQARPDSGLVLDCWVKTDDPASAAQWLHRFGLWTGDSTFDRAGSGLEVAVEYVGDEETMWLPLLYLFGFSVFL